ncbi:MAG: hypothetical protein K2H69_06510, partial [Alistipes sp.]|nr:hypothetical protein [Alistipes sp.]
MKHYLLYAFLTGAFLLSGCEKEERVGNYKGFASDYSIVHYVDGDLEVRQDSYYLGQLVQDAPVPVALFVSWTVTKDYLAPELSDPERSDHPCEPANTEEFRAIAARNGDVPSFEKCHWGGAPIYMIYDAGNALSDNFTSLHLTCDTAWDESHPAGAPLDDLVTVEFESYADKIAEPNNWHDFRRSYRLSELPSDAMRMVALYSHSDNYPYDERPCLCVIFDEAVDFPGSRKLTLTLAAADGRTWSASCGVRAD